MGRRFSSLCKLAQFPAAFLLACAFCPFPASPNAPPGVTDLTGNSVDPFQLAAGKAVVFIFVRTDARQMNGLDDAIDRVNRCCDCGADIAFIEAPESLAELEEIPKRVKHPLFVNMLTGGVTPILSVKELEQLGYKIVVCPIESLMVCAKAMRELCDTWKNTGRVDKLATQAMSFAEVKELLGVETFLKLREGL